MPAAHKKGEHKIFKRMMFKVVEADRERCMPLLWGIYKSLTYRVFSNSTL